MPRLVCTPPPPRKRHRASVATQVTFRHLSHQCVLRIGRLYIFQADVDGCTVVRAAQLSAAWSGACLVLVWPMRTRCRPNKSRTTDMTSTHVFDIQRLLAT